MICYAAGLIVSDLNAEDSNYHRLSSVLVALIVTGVSGTISLCVLVTGLLIFKRSQGGLIFDIDDVYPSSTGSTSVVDAYISAACTLRPLKNGQHVPYVMGSGLDLWAGTHCLSLESAKGHEHDTVIDGSGLFISDDNFHNQALCGNSDSHSNGFTQETTAGEMKCVADKDGRTLSYSRTLTEELMPDGSGEGSHGFSTLDLTLNHNHSSGRL